MRIKYLISATEKSAYPKGRCPEVALAGRSNAGKSSLINAWARASVAHVSQTPGKTQTLNFYDANDFYRLVDMPGYGFAARGDRQVHQWADVVEGYLRHRKNLVGLLLIIDSRRSWTEDEQMLVDWWTQRDRPWAVVLTKSDKLTASEKLKKIKEFQQFVGSAPIHLVSSLKRQGVDDLENFIFQNWVNKPS